MIQVFGLTKSFGGRKVLKNLDFSADRGEIVALIGVNGAGKTTLIRILSTLMKPDTGQISINGVNISKSGIHTRRRVGVVLHSPMVYGELTGGENLMFYAKLYGIPQARARIDQVLKIVDLNSRINDLVRTYSRGMQQRLSIGRAILHNPEILLMDEPFTGLDQGSAINIGGMFSELKDDGKTILFTTHDLSRILANSTRVDILHSGRIDATFPTSQIAEDELHNLFKTITGKAISAESQLK
jgi:heme exporter protein A